MTKARANGEGSIRQRQDGRWEVRITVGIDFMTGEPRRISRYTNTQDKAVHLLHTLQVAYSQGNDIVGEVTVKEWLEVWLTIYMKNGLKQSTYTSYACYLKNHFIPALGKLPLRDLSPRILQQFYNFKLEQEGLSPKTITNLNLCLHKALEHAVREGLISSNPASSINLPRSDRPQIEVLTLDAQARLVQASYSHRYGFFIRLVLVTGLRMGELLGLKWEDIDFRSSMLHVRRTLNRLQKPGLTEGFEGSRTEIVLQEPKTRNSIRTIPLLPMVMQELRQWRSVQQADEAIAGDSYMVSGMIVTNPMGGYIEPRTFKDYYDQILKLAGIGHFTFHALRHTFATRALEQGMDPKTLSILLGHYSVSFTLDTYAHVLDDHKWEGMQLMGDLCFLGQTAPNPAYPILVTPQTDGGYLLNAPDFPTVACVGDTLDHGLQQVRELLQDKLHTYAYPPMATSPADLIPQPGQMVIQVAI